MTSLLLLVVTISSSLLGSASVECAGGNSVLVVPWTSVPTVCLPLDDYIQLQKDASSDGESTPPASAVSPIPSLRISSSALLLYHYMSPLWLQNHANFMETPSSVSARTIEFASGPVVYGVLFRVKLIEAGVLDDDKAYSIQIGFHFMDPGDSDPILQICDGNYCVGFLYYIPHSAYALGDIDSVSHCSGTGYTPIAAPQSSTTNWNIRLEIHPKSTSGITYVGTKSLTYEYSQKLKPSQGLKFKVCREGTLEQFQFHLFELAVYLNE